MLHESGQSLFERACRVMPGGVNSPVRAFQSVGQVPLFVRAGQGPYVIDAEGKRYLDFLASFGPLIVGHAHPHIVDAICQAASEGTSFGACTKREVLLAERLCGLVPSLEQIRFVNSGTEATMSAVRLARGYTGRNLMVKFSGCYHGHGDHFLTDAGSGLATLDVAQSAGVPPGTIADTITLPYNDLTSLERLFTEQGHQVACVIVEPIACNIGMLPPLPAFLQGICRLCSQYGAVSIFDEVITGFRVHLQGAQGLYELSPDMTTYGKIIGGGLPVGAYGGRKDIMACVAPLGPVYQAGTLSGNPLAMAAGLACTDLLLEEHFYRKLDERCKNFFEPLQQLLQQHGDLGYLSSVGSIFHIWWQAGARKSPLNSQQIKQADNQRFKQVFAEIRKRGILMAPSAFEVAFVSNAHQTAHLEQALEVFAEVLPLVASKSKSAG